MGFNLTWEEVKNLKEGATCAMGCSECEGHEVHEKRDGKWVCQNCGNNEIDV